jgi:hypothetical protein
MSRRRFCAFLMLALFAVPGFATPAIACQFSRPVFSAQPNPVQGVEVKVRVEQTLLRSDGRVIAVRALLLGDSSLARRGERIIIIVPTRQPDICNYWGFADPETVAADGSLTGYIDLVEAREPSGAFSAVAAHRSDARLYDRLARAGRAGEWVAARFTPRDVSADMSAI